MHDTSGEAEPLEVQMIFPNGANTYQLRTTPLGMVLHESREPFQSFGRCGIPFPWELPWTIIVDAHSGRC